MSTKGKFGELPPSGPGAAPRAPLPLVTQPMIPVERDPQDHDPGATRVDNPLQSLKPESAAALFGRTTTISTSGPLVPASPASKALVPGGAPPEVGLTQHHLPDEQHDARLSLVIDPDSERSAAFRVLRHHLLEVGRPQCVVVSSANPGEGKTTVAVNLALALAECGRAKVLLVETHVRRPQLATLFKFVPPWCFAEQLVAHRQQPMLPWSLVEIPQLWLHVAAINPRTAEQQPQRTQLLDGPAFAIAIERLRLAGYEHIVVDAPPVLGSADVNLLSDAADAVLMVVKSRSTTTRDLRRAIEQIGPGKVAGTVLI